MAVCRGSCSSPGFRVATAKVHVGVLAKGGSVSHLLEGRIWRMRNGLGKPLLGAGRRLRGGCAPRILGDGGTALAAATSPPSSGSQQYVVVLKGDQSAAQVLQDAKADGASPQRTYSYALSGYSADLTSTPERAAQTRTWPWLFQITPQVGIYARWRASEGRGCGGRQHQPAGTTGHDYSQFIPTALERIFLQIPCSGRQRRWS